MPIYIVRLNAAFPGFELIEVEGTEDYQVGQTVQILANEGATFFAEDGRSVALDNGVAISGTIVSVR
ncbi:MAG: hypothetical protein JSU70_18870 [Phycisphaerales bacterium]|nr:MAG: hypothetical protein JSU70_18870 [Phycisphaerales bacterium]